MCATLQALGIEPMGTSVESFSAFVQGIRVKNEHHLFQEHLATRVARRREELVVGGGDHARLPAAYRLAFSGSLTVRRLEFACSSEARLPVIPECRRHRGCGRRLEIALRRLPIMGGTISTHATITSHTVMRETPSSLYNFRSTYTV
jgi:hypothetical protein